MERWFRLYNQNRRNVWVAILVIIFVLLIIRTLNGIYRDAKNQDNTIVKNTTENEVSYKNQSESLVSGGSVSEAHQEQFGKLIDNFLTYYKNHEPEKAYGLLSEDCKNILYPNETIFEQQYYKNKFTSEKKYSFQSWTSKDTYIYRVKIFNNMLATGTGNSEKYIQDYISIVKENDSYKLNVNGFVGKVQRNKEASKKGVTIKVNNSEIYMDYEIINITVKNSTENTILLDSRKNSNSIYEIDANNNEFEAITYENSEDDFIVEPGEEKQIKIKFSNPYREQMTAIKYVFSDIYMDTNNVQYGSNNVEITVDLY